MTPVKTKYTKEEISMWTPLQFAEVTGAWDFVERMLRAGKSLRELKVLPEALKSTSEAVKLVNVFCENEHLSLLRYALSEQPEVAGARSESGLTPLHVAAGRGRTAALRLLLRSGAAHVEAGDRWGRTALLHAAAGGYADALRLLLAAGARHDARDYTGHTALQYAARAGHGPAVRLLCDAGAAQDAGRSAAATS
ncbi:ankyrin repeat domain-containing protein 65-like [Schistocerca cancellata]|uniref:ankyrin repeat domain-containing protein 65-like n=1 Tax=Schistocerca cancellata TaxID=274614 RepID=UPI0021196AE4|nr:ankyrin repeat domain-containing protein 65-like [Schistocerca cancellata]